MPTRVSLWCSRFIEAGWVAVLLVTPLFFQTATVRVFEPDKMMLVRTIALVMGAAWIVRVIDSRLRPPAGEPGRMPRALLWPILLLVAAYVLATLVSVTPWASLFGSYQRGQGLYSFLALVVIFVLILNDLRRRDQVERLVTAVVLTSIPAALFAVMQGLGIQPGVWRGLYGGRVFGTLGNPIFLAGYLLMVIPVTVARLLMPATPSEGEEQAAEGAVVVAPLVRQVVYGIALVLQLAAFALAYSRGPLLGLADGIGEIGVEPRDAAVDPRPRGGVGEQVEHPLPHLHVLPEWDRPVLGDDDLVVAADLIEPLAELLGVAHRRRQ